MLSATGIGEHLRLGDDDPRKLTVVPAPGLDGILDRGATSIDLRLGRWFRSFKQTQFGSVPLAARRGDADQASQVGSRTKQHFVPFGEAFVLHPGRFVLGATLEWLRLPGCLSGYVTGKSAHGRHGLVIETAAGIHPHFSGCLTLELANVGEVPLEIYPGMEICQIFLHETVASDAVDIGAFSGRRKPHLSAPKADKILAKLSDGRLI